MKILKIKKKETERPERASQVERYVIKRKKHVVEKCRPPE